MAGNNQMVILAITKMIEEFSKNFPNVTNDKETIAMWGRQLKNFETVAIKQAQDVFLRDKTGHIQIADFIPVVRRFDQELILKEEKVRKPVPMPAEFKKKFDVLLTKLST